MKDKYLKIATPQSIRDQFLNAKDFENWLRIDYDGTHIQDLEQTLEAFVNEEMYEDCIIIKKVLDETLFNYYYPITAN